MKKQNTVKLTLTALFIAIMLVMNFTILGYIPAGGFTITLMTLPVIVGAICCGPLMGGILGSVFGLTSFLQCFGVGYFIDPMASILYNSSPIGTIVTCFLPRIIMGVLVGLVFKFVVGIDKKGYFSYAIASACGPLFNTVLFMTSYFVFFKNTLLAQTTVKAIVVSALSLNFLVEIIVALMIGTVISRILHNTMKKL